MSVPAAAIVKFLKIFPPSAAATYTYKYARYECSSFPPTTLLISHLSSILINRGRRDNLNEVIGTK
jgi:hypothetical protein